MPQALELLLWTAAVMATVMTALFALQAALRNAGIVDVAWSYAVGAVAVAYALMADGDPARRILVALLAGAWGCRLGTYLLVNRVLGCEEDSRYRELRTSWGTAYNRNLFLFYQAQSVFVVIFAVPFLPAVYNSAPLSIWDALGAAVWIAAVAGETLADRQLAGWRAKPVNAGRTCRRGLWRYSRHPNYFFEWVHWWAYVLLAVGSPFGWVALSGPVTMLLFLYYVTGIPHTEKQALRKRGADYREYQRSTSAFFPWFPRKDDR